MSWSLSDEEAVMADAARTLHESATRYINEKRALQAMHDLLVWLLSLGVTDARPELEFMATGDW